jgi:hypothetical protein
MVILTKPDRKESSMNKVFAIMLSAAVAAGISGCMSVSSDTLRARSGPEQGEKLEIAGIGLSQEAVEKIWATKFPKKPVVSLSFIVFPSSYRGNPVEDDLKLALIRALDGLEFVDRVVPVPSFITPSPLSFEAIQQLGIRSLCEYSVVLRAEENKDFSYTLLSKNMYRFESKLEYLVVDNETTAIIAADILNSSEDVRIELFSDEAIRKAKESIYAEQEELIRAKMGLLFSKAH